MTIYDAEPRAGYRLDGMPRASETASTVLWLCEIATRLQNEKAKLIAGYRRHDVPDHVAEAIDLIEQAQEELANERRELDAISGSAS